MELNSKIIPENTNKSIKGIHFSLKKSFSIDKLIGTLALFISLYHLYCAYFGQPEEMIFRTTFLSSVMLLCFLTRPLGKKLWEGKINFLFIINLFFILFPLIAQYYILHDIQDWYMKFGNPTTTDVIMGSVYIAVLLEATRRTIGLQIVIIAIFFLFNAVFADRMNFGFFYGPPMPWRTLVNFIWIEQCGIFGLPIMVVSSVVTLFLIFASILEKSNVGKIIMDLAYAITGHSVGGTAKAAVIGSGFMGTISGSSIANVVTTGTVTIPLMKKIGYKAEYAGGVEAAASTGGQIMPPIMGATAFIIAEFIGISYIKLAIYAFIPAFLYYVSVFYSIHYASINGQVRPVPKSYLPNLRDTLKRGSHMLIPLPVLVIFLLKGYSIQTTVFWVIMLTFILSFLRSATRFTPKSFLEALEGAPKKFIQVAMACGTAGIIVGSISVSGLGWRVSNSLLSLSGGNITLTLFFTMIICIILGMGMTTTPVYIVVAAIAVPPLIKLGIPVVAAHLFAFYFGVISGITPPVAVTSFAAASVAVSNMAKTSFYALKIAVAGFIIPFIFCSYPSLLLTYGSLFDTLFVLGITTIALLCLTSGLNGWFLRQLNLFESVIIGFLPIFFLLYKDVRKPANALIFLAIFGTIIALQKLLPYSSKIDKLFNFKIQKPKEKEKSFNLTDDLFTITKQKLGFNYQGHSADSKKDLFIGWAIWAIILVILIVLGDMHFMTKHFNYFLLILFIMSCFGKVLLDNYKYINLNIKKILRI